MAYQNKPKSSQTASSNRSRATNTRRQNHQEQQSAVARNTKVVEHSLPVDLQQSILNVFTQAFPVVSQHADFKNIMQEVKGHLYHRDFEAAFGKPEYLDVYAARWSAARALAYANIFTHPHRKFVFEVTADDQQTSLTQGSVTRNGPGRTQSPSLGYSTDPESSNRDSQIPELKESGESICTVPSNIQRTQLKVLCIGGGAGAEIVALAATFRHVYPECHNVRSQSDQLPSLTSSYRLDILAADLANWLVPVKKIKSALTTPPTLPGYATQATRDKSGSLVDPAIIDVNVQFSQGDILDSTSTSLSEILKDVRLITVMFTLNELFTSSLPKTTALLLNLTETAEVGTHLMVVDSPGSYSEIELNKSRRGNDTPKTKRYPMKWLLDHALLHVAGKDDDARWIKIEDEESKWFRIDEKLGLRYGIELENCRYQIHVFRKVK